MTKPQAVTMTMNFQVNPKTGKAMETKGLDPLDVLYAYSLLCTGITEAQAEELNNAHTQARHRVQTLRETIQWIIEDPRTDSKMKDSLIKVLREL